MGFCDIFGRTFVQLSFRPKEYNVGVKKELLNSGAVSVKSRAGLEDMIEDGPTFNGGGLDHTSVPIDAQSQYAKEEELLGQLGNEDSDEEDDEDAPARKKAKVDGSEKGNGASTAGGLITSEIVLKKSTKNMGLRGLL